MRRGTSINESFQKLKSHIWESNLSQKYAGGEPPLRSELFSTEQMEQYGRVLAGQHAIGSNITPEQNLLDRLAENEGLLLEVHSLVSKAVEANRPITPAGEWFLDNFYLIEEQIRIGKKHLPKGYSKELPRLSEGPSAGLPRVYDIAKEIIAHGDGFIDPESLNRFIKAYQAVSVLKLGELWAIPIMLRLALIENLRRVAVRIAAGRIDRDIADTWADKMIEITEKDPKNLILVIADMARSEPPVSSAFVSEFVRRLTGQNPALAFPLTWIEQRLAESNQTTIQLIEIGSQQQAADQVSISNSIGSLRFLSSLDWRKFVESMSSVEQILLSDPAGVYGSMDFQTRDQYRHIVEKTAKKTSYSESEIAQKAIELAQRKAGADVNDDRTGHVGYYLSGKGLSLLEQSAGLKRWPVSRYSLLLYLGSILVFTLLISLSLLGKARNDGVEGWQLWLIGFILLISGSQVAIAVVNWLSSLLVKPKLLPRLDFSEGIPPESRTLVVIPTMITSEKNIERLVEDLQVRFLANQDKNLHFGLLTDFKDSRAEKEENDDKLIAYAEKKIRELNRIYPGENKDRFFLFHRPRKWNPADRIWMGYERKRGKLADLNALLRENISKNFSHITGRTGVLKSVKYVITLDTDTQLPRDSARQMAGTMAHPLNQPYYDLKKQRVTDGYTILQPRVAVSLPGTNRSRYAKLFGNEPGIDPYTRAVSDVYQDVFDEGSFIGKGVYNLEYFERALKDRFPENRILSHDLLEGCYARSGLLSDVLLFEEYPERYETDVKRRSRWIRGDWQLFPWLFPILPKLNGASRKNPLSVLSWWKIFDNLRRSLVPLALLLLLAAGWTFLPSAVFWTVVVLVFISMPALISGFVYASQKPDEVMLQQHLKSAGKKAILHLQQTVFTIISLPFEAWFSTHAIVKTCWRLFFSKKNLLEWNSGGNSERAGVWVDQSYRFMWFSTFFAAVSTAYLLAISPLKFLIAWPFVAAWFLFPTIAWWISLTLEPGEAKLSTKQIRFLKDLSRKTWFFFEKFVGPEDNWLPPDNFQEDPGSMTAHRTSPTNIGLSLLANLSAWDFGYINSGELIERTSNTFRTMGSLEKYQGHFLNWYDTRSLKPLRPLYVSSVDSGNLAAHLITLKQGLITVQDQPVTGQRYFEGINDTLHLLTEKAGKNLPASIGRFRKNLIEILETPPLNLAFTQEKLERLTLLAGDIERSLRTDSDEEYVTWVKKLSHSCRNSFNELHYLAPWLMHSHFAEISEKFPVLNVIPTLREIAGRLNELPDKDNNGLDSEAMDLLKLATEHARQRIDTIEVLANQAEEFSRMQYGFLYDKSRHLQTIGYNVEERRADSSYYDLLASEARLASYVAIAQDQVPQESWFAMGRLLTTLNGEPVLLSWSGSMFEYLMPMLVMPSYENSLLHQTCKAAVMMQIEYGNQRGIPWGISESGYNRVDAQLNYQYRAFGVPGLGLKRGLTDDLVIAPYATALALMVMPEDACDNLLRMADEGFMGRYGFYEAIDYTQFRVPRGLNRFIVKSYMAHHQGMSFLSLSHVLHNRPMQKRFEADPGLQSALLLLQERIPRSTAFFAHTSAVANVRTSVSAAEMPMRVFSTPNTQYPEIKLLSNGRYRVLVTNAGGGFSHWKDLALTRWREDVTSDNWGSFCYIRDIQSGEYWSSAFQPTLKKPEKYEAIFSEGRAEFRRRDHDIDTYTEIAVSPEDDIELRRVRLTNHTRMKRIIDITSYAEVVLAPNNSDLAHPAFSNLFVTTEIYPQRHAILCTRRPRSVQEEPPWMFHQMAVHGAEILNITYETDRSKFIGRGNTLVSPEAMTGMSQLTGSQGSVLDPVVAIQFRIVLEPEASATVDMITGISPGRDGAISLVEKYQDKLFANRVFELAWTHSQVVLQQINATEPDAQLFGRLASSVIYANPLMRADPSIILKNRRGQSGLWGYSISGDLPIVLLRIEDPANINLVRQLVQAHAYWRLKGLAVDLVIWNEDHAGYRQLLQDQILGLITAGVEANVIDRPGGIFVRSIDQISNEDRILFQTVARVVLSDSKGTLANQLKRRHRPDLLPSTLIPTRSYKPAPNKDLMLQSKDLTFYNGTGGFNPDGTEYVITTNKNSGTPAPWVNVLANEGFGSVISERGMSYTWAENSHEYRLTPWNNDPVRDSGGEAIYIRDEETGYFWSPVPLVAGVSSLYVCRHGFGYSVFEHQEGDIITELLVYVAKDAPIKFSVLKIKNSSARPVKLSVTNYVEWVLGELRHKSGMHIISSSDPVTNTLYAVNPYNPEFPNRVAFIQTDEPSWSFTCDRTEFLGRNGTLQNPEALSRSKLSGRKGVSLDPCGAIQVSFELLPGQEREIVFRLGSGKDMEEAATIVRRFRGSVAAQTRLEAVRQFWRHTLGSVQVETPDLSLNILANGWLLYQTLACRVWARTGFYQSGGAYGFRDQLQDAMALIHSKPGILRDLLLVFAGRQFPEGDVQHWWHPPVGRGVRTHCSDDYLWLPLATSRYVLSTGDTGVLDENIHFIEGRPVNPEDDSYYDLPNRSDETGSLYEHCKRSILHGLRFGEHGLPLIGTHDWNDGMNLIGHQGRGESVWLGFFLFDVVMQFAHIAQLKGDLEFIETCNNTAKTLKENIDKNAWDGEWYRRAYFDNGLPLGSSENEECQIDSISQSWSILSGAGKQEKSKQAMESVSERLVRRDYALVQLLDPPFDKSDLNPGYIKGYVPGVRENGGQYTHAAIWVAMAYAKMGDNKQAWEILNIINPIRHALTPDEMTKYKVEPYVIAADVYAVAPHTGRGGWTWYTGSAGWMYRLITESVLGLTLEVDRLYFKPCVPPDWNSYRIRYRFRETFYLITLIQDNKAPAITIRVDGKDTKDNFITLIDDQREHQAEILY